jgi:hypothetical protein
VTPAELVEASRAVGHVQPGARGRWMIHQLTFPIIPRSAFRLDLEAKLGLSPGEEYMALRALPSSGCLNGAETVMDDGRRELRRHLPILMRASGRVLVTGLGLGCVVRGLLSKPDVEHVTVVEIDANVAELVWSSIEASPRFLSRGRPRAKLIVHDALQLELPGRFDYAWHDLWCEGEGLQRLHVELLGRFRHQVGHQGAWELPREVKALLRARNWPLLG